MADNAADTYPGIEMEREERRNNIMQNLNEWR